MIRRILAALLAVLFITGCTEIDVAGPVEEVPVDVDAKAQEVHDFITGLMIMARIHNSLDGLERDLRPGLMRILELEPTVIPVEA